MAAAEVVAMVVFRVQKKKKTSLRISYVLYSPSLVYKYIL